ncbi:hypothetical protein [Heterosigma akashiwo virus 01]|uniref:Uncharacterized protein n=1 Tax=Heterosigma akashiwo virus 01 TaxID=97195 RepID=A0A1C9C5B1_HAV01|nr:hypothetical protein D1R72_gp143 [Heterosigma akashiwo virus 01]AOM63474.1 hypothetical protein [Heterosigma akashiwo virus 01]
MDKIMNVINSEQMIKIRTAIDVKLNDRNFTYMLILSLCVLLFIRILFTFIFSRKRKKVSYTKQSQSMQQHVQQLHDSQCQHQQYSPITQQVASYSQFRRSIFILCGLIIFIFLSKYAKWYNNKQYSGSRMKYGRSYNVDNRRCDCTHRCRCGRRHRCRCGHRYRCNCGNSHSCRCNCDNQRRYMVPKYYQHDYDIDNEDIGHNYIPTTKLDNIKYMDYHPDMNYDNNHMGYY